MQVGYTWICAHLRKRESHPMCVGDDRRRLTADRGGNFRKIVEIVGCDQNDLLRVMESG